MSPDSAHLTRERLKSETRRVITLPRWTTGNYGDCEEVDNQLLAAVHGSKTAQISDYELRAVNSPYGSAEQVLWVRERYGFTPSKQLVRESDEGHNSVDFWRPAHLMPRRLSNLSVKVDSVEVTKLSEITAYQAIAEGCPPEFWDSPIAWYARVWDELNAKRGYPWSGRAYYWVWRIKFEVILDD